MIRLATCTGLLFGIAVYTVSWAQQRPPLRASTERLATAQALERQALVQHDRVGLAEAFYQYGRTYIFAGNYKTSQGYFLHALRLLEPRSDSPELARIYVRLSENESRLGRQADALRYARLALTVARRIRNPRSLLLAYGVVAHIQEAIWEQHLPGFAVSYDSVETYYQRKIPLFRAMNDTLGMAETWLELGTLYTKVRDRRAVPYLAEALRLTRLLHRNQLLPNAMLHLATAYLTFGQPERAFQLLRDASTFYTANRFDDYDTILGLERGFVRYYRTTGQWQRAYEHLEAAHQLQQSEMLSDREAAIARLGVEYETQKRDAQIRAKTSQLALQTENWQTQRKLTWLTSTLLAMAVGMSGLFFWLLRKNQRVSRRNEELVKEQNHRVKNNMQVVASLLLMQANRLTDETARQAVEESRLRVQAMAILHQRLYDGDRLARVDLPDFIRQLTGGVLSAYGFKRVRTTITVDPITLPAERAQPLGLIINEVLTNACKHAFPHATQPALQLSCQQRGNQIHLRIQDNGPGLDGPGLDGPGLDGPGLDGSGLEGMHGTHDDPVLPAADDLLVMPRRSFGMQLIQSLTEQLGGTGRFRSEQGGVFVLEFAAD